MSHHRCFEADLGLLNLDFVEPDSGKVFAPFFDDMRVWDMPGNGLMNNGYGSQALNQAIQLSEYLLPDDSPIEEVSPLPACLYEPALMPNPMDLTGPVLAGFDAESARFALVGEMHSTMNSAHPLLFNEDATTVPNTSGSHMADVQEPIKRSRGRPKGSKTKQRVSLLASRRNVPKHPINVFEPHFSQHPSKPKTPEEKAQVKLEKAAIRLAKQKASREAKEAERKATAAAKKLAKQNSLAGAGLDGSISNLRV